ncbi:hypothetical protein CCACVL1_00740, partial [Corchorus capsularis]
MFFEIPILALILRYYIEPRTGHPFRSLRAVVERYLVEMEARAAASKPHKATFEEAEKKREDE